MFVIYDTDLDDEQWALVARYIPAAKTGGRPRTNNARAILNGVLYVVKTGCHWRSLPKDFPPWQTVYRYFAEWRKRGVYRKLHAALYPMIRVLDNRALTPSALVIDTQSVKTGKYAAVDTRGFDGGKKVKGRKRIMVVDTLGNMVDASILPANTHDTKCAQHGLSRICKKLRKVVATVKTVFADKGFQGSNLAGWVKTNIGARMNVTENLTKSGGPFVPTKKRWVVERAFAWMGDYYRLSVDRERDPRNSLAMVRLASIRLMLRRLVPPPTFKWESPAET